MLANSTGSSNVFGTRGIMIALFLCSLVSAVGFWQYQHHLAPPSSQANASASIGIVEGGPLPDGIPSIDRPSYESVPAADPYLKDDGYGLVVKRGGTARFYPFQLLVWHEIVNDDFDGLPLLVTYSPLSAAAAVFERRVNGQSVAFGVSGKILDGNLVMYDRPTGSLWSQLRGQAIEGEREGTALVPYPATVMRWARFKRLYPYGRVLSRTTGVTRDYTRDPYAGYADGSAVPFPVGHKDGRLPLKEPVHGVRLPLTAYPDSTVRKVKIVNDTVATLPFVIWEDPATEAIRGFVAEADGQALTFALEGKTLVDLETQSVWDYDGSAIGGPLRGTELVPLLMQPAYWFSWVAAYPETKLYE